MRARDMASDLLAAIRQKRQRAVDARLGSAVNGRPDRVFAGTPNKGEESVREHGQVLVTGRRDRLKNFLVRAPDDGFEGRSGGPEMEAAMARKFIDCREVPSEMKCTLAISADTEAEVLEAAVQHAVAIHGHQDTPELREFLKGAIREGTPPVEAPSRAA